MKNWNWTPRAQRIGYGIVMTAFLLGLEITERLLDWWL